MSNNNQNNVVYAGFFIRLSAYLIDMIIVTSLLAILRLPVWIMSMFNPDSFLTKSVIFNFSIWDIFLYLLGVTYFIVITYKTGTTIGKALMRIKVVSVEGELTFLNVCYRETIGRYLSSVILYVGYILIGADAEKRGLHDMLCDTRVVYKDMVKEEKPPVSFIREPVLEELEEFGESQTDQYEAT
jgi:uncharacterized RDD family membrane protein YckC